MIKSPPDGYTLERGFKQHVIYPSVLKSVPFDPVKDITAIAVMGTTPMVLVVNPKVPANNAKELIALLKSEAGIGSTIASSGNGTILHLAAEMFLDEAGVKAKHIPYKGVGPMLTDLIGGQVDFGVLALPSIQAHLKSGALRAIGTSSAQRLAAAPEIPTFAEQGLPKYVVEGWFAVVGPKGLPAAEVKRIHAAFASAFNSPDVKETMAKQGNTISMTSPEEAQAFFRQRVGQVRGAGEEIRARASIVALRAALPHPVRMTEMCSVPLSGSHTSPARPRIWRTLALSRGKPNRSNFSARGSKANTALPPKSLTHTVSRSST